MNWSRLPLLAIALALIFAAISAALVLYEGGARHLWGGRGARWPPRSALMALARALARARTSPWLWLPGLLFPGVRLTLEILRGALVQLHHSAVDLLGLEVAGSPALHPLSPWFLDGGLPRPGADALAALPGGELLGSLLLAVLLLGPLLVVFRCNVGLAYVCADPHWRQATREGRPPPLRALWRAGRGVSRSAFALWIALHALLTVAVLLLAGPLIALVDSGWGAAALHGGAVIALVAVATLLCAYGIALQILGQLALQSLAHNRRGAASALVHAWRLALNDPLATLRAALVSLVLAIGILAAELALAASGGLLPASVAWLVLVPMLALQGFAGVARASYWAQAYPALGGLSAVDGVPGLASGPAASESEIPRPRRS